MSSCLQYTANHNAPDISFSAAIVSLNVRQILNGSQCLQHTHTTAAWSPDSPCLGLHLRQALQCQMTKEF